MENSKNAKKKTNAVLVPDALESFVFGKAKTAPVKNSQCDPE